MKKIFGLPWTQLTSTTTGLPRPYYDVPKARRLTPKGMLAKRIPIPWQTIPLFHNPNRQLGVLVEHESKTHTEYLCGYCGIGFTENEVCVIWVTYPTNTAERKNRVYSDHFPLHVECMSQARAFCPHMKLTEDSEYEFGLFSQLLLKAQKFKDQMERQQQGL